MIEVALNLQNEPNFSGLDAFEGEDKAGEAWSRYGDLAGADCVP